MAIQILGERLGKNLRNAKTVAYAEKLAKQYPEQAWALYKQGQLPGVPTMRKFKQVKNIGLIVGSNGRVKKWDVPAIGVNKKVGIVAWTYVKVATANTARPSNYGPYSAAPWYLINLKPIDTGSGPMLPIGCLCGKVAGLHNIDKNSTTAYIAYGSKAMQNSYVPGTISEHSNLFDNTQVHGRLSGGSCFDNTIIAKGAYIAGGARLYGNTSIISGDYWNISTEGQVTLSLPNPGKFEFTGPHTRALKGAKFVGDVYISNVKQNISFEYSFNPLRADNGKCAYGNCTNIYKNIDGKVYIAFYEKTFEFSKFRQTFLRQAKNLGINPEVYELNWSLLKYYAGTL